MPKVAKRRQATGCIRRDAKHKKSSYSRAMHLSHAEVRFRNFLQTCMALHCKTALSALRTLPALIVIYALIRNDVIDSVPNAEVAIQSLIHIQGVRYILNHNRMARCLRLDYIYHDIPPEEEAQQRIRMPRQNIRFSSWTDQECYDFTSFRKDQLIQIYDQFELEDLANETNGRIRVFNGHEHYCFHPEEIFLFLMTKCKTGLSNKIMCDLLFGGNACRWSYGFPWLLRYLDDRYEDIIGHQGLARYVDQFPKFYEKIQERVRKTTIHHYNDGTAEEFAGLRFLPYSIFGFIDCSIYRIERPYSGPDGDYIGAPRKERYYQFQRAVYTRQKKLHGIKVETVLLPNGISTISGPYSARPHDVGGVLNMSGLDQFLFVIQQGNEHMYSAFGDAPYNAGYLQCVRSYFRAAPGGQLTPYQEVCNNRIKPCREAIEWSYGDVSKLFQLSAAAKNYRLGKRHPYAQEQVRICHFLTNIYNCLNGDKTSAMFNCPPPSLRDYLSLD